MNIPNKLLTPHHHHYHIDFNPMDRVRIQQGTNKLLATSSIMQDDLIQNTNFNATAFNQFHDEVLRDFAIDFNLPESEMELSFYPPDEISTSSVQAVLVASKLKKENIIGVCQVVGKGFAGVPSFGAVAQDHLTIYKGKDPTDVDVSRVKIQVVSITRQPQHGKLVLILNDKYGGTYHYYPDEGFVGKDKVEALVSVGSDVVRVLYDFVVQTEVVDQLPDRVYLKYCPRQYWKISSNRIAEPSELAQWITTRNLTSMLANASTSLAGFSDLQGAAVGGDYRSGHRRPDHFR